MINFLRKSIGLIFLIVGILAWAGSLIIVIMLIRDSTNPPYMEFIIDMIFCGFSFSLTYFGWKLWKGRRRPQEGVVSQTFEPASGGRAPKPAGLGGVPNGSVTVECPGCGAPVKVESSDGGECEYCGNQVQYRRPSGNG